MLLVSAGFLIASVIGDLKHSLFTLVVIAMGYPIYVFGIKKKTAVTSDAEMHGLNKAEAE